MQKNGILLKSEIDGSTKVIHRKYFKHLKEATQRSHLGRKKCNGFWQLPEGKVNV